MKTMLLLNADMEKPGIVYDGGLIGYLRVMDKGMQIEQTAKLDPSVLAEIVSDLNKMHAEFPDLILRMKTDLPKRHQHVRASQAIRLLDPESKRHIQIGSAEHVKPGFLNIDYWPNSGIDFDPDTNFANLDIRLGLPLDDESVTFAYSSHMLEHLTFDEAKAHLVDILRVLVPEGILRMCLPDMGKTARRYAVRDEPYFRMLNEDFRFLGYMPEENRLYGDLMSRHILESCTHKYFWDFENLSAALKAVGFVGIAEVPYDMDMDRSIALRLETSFCLEALKPG